MMGWFRKLIRSFRFLQFVSAVRWGLAGNIVIAWFVTMPPRLRDRGGELLGGGAGRVSAQRGKCST